MSFGPSNLKFRSRGVDTVLLMEVFYTLSVSSEIGVLHRQPDKGQPQIGASDNSAPEAKNALSANRAKFHVNFVKVF